MTKMKRYGYNTQNWGQDEILDCLAVAVGVNGLKDLVINTKTLATFEAATA